MFTDVLSWPICFMFDDRESLYATFNFYQWQQRRRLKNLATTYPLVSVYEYGVDYIYSVGVKGLICVAGQHLFWWSVRLFAVC